MKKYLIGQLVLGFLVCHLTAVSFAEESAKTATTDGAEAPSKRQPIDFSKAAQQVIGKEGPAYKTMAGGIRSLDKAKKIFSFTPDNVGDPLEVTCELNSADCTLQDLAVGQDVKVEMLNVDGAWQAHSVTLAPPKKKAV